MSDSSVSIVPRLSNYKAKEQKAKNIVEWLVSLDIVKPILSDCVLGAEGGYQISMGAKKVSEEPELLPFAIHVNGLEIITQRQVFHTGQNGLDGLICPSCSEDISDEAGSLINGWSEEVKNGFTCPLCNIESDIHQYKFSPQWGFSDLGFTFWNWSPFTESFIEDFKQRLSCDVDVIYSRI